MQYEVFVDRLFLFHFVMQFLSLLLTARLGSLKAGWGRLIGAAAAGAAAFVALLLWPLPGKWGMAGPVKFVLQLAGSFFMLQLAFRLRGFGSLLRAAGIYGGAACLLGGILTAWDRTGQRMSAILLPAIAAAFLSLWWLGREKEKKGRRLVEICLQEGKIQVETSALIDSGNSLTEPLTGRPVCVADSELLRQLGLMEKGKGFCLIPYHSIGREHGLLQAFTVEKMYLMTGGQRLLQKGVLLAASDGQLTQKGSYRLLLHPALLEETKGVNKEYDIKSSDAGKNAV